VTSGKPQRRLPARCLHFRPEKGHCQTQPGKRHAAPAKAHSTDKLVTELSACRLLGCCIHFRPLLRPLPDPRPAGSRAAGGSELSPLSPSETSRKTCPTRRPSTAPCRKHSHVTKSKAEGPRHTMDWAFRGKLRRRQKVPESAAAQHSAM
jgi:hypothetical protein